MTWTNKLPKAPSKGQEIWDTNGRLQLEWNNHVAKRGAKNTQRNHRVYVGVFLRSFDALATTLEREDIEAFVARIETKCAKLMNGSKPSCLAKQPISTCPLLRGAGDYTVASSIQPWSASFARGPGSGGSRRYDSTSASSSHSGGTLGFGSG